MSDFYHLVKVMKAEKDPRPSKAKKDAGKKASKMKEA